MSLFEDTYLTVTKPSEGIFKDRGSKFIAYVYPVVTEAEVKDRLGHLRKSISARAIIATLSGWEPTRAHGAPMMTENQPTRQASRYSGRYNPKTLRMYLLWW